MNKLTAPRHSMFSRDWLYIAPLSFGVVSILSLVITDMVIIPNGELHFSKEPIWLAVVFTHTVFFSFLAGWLWLAKGWKFFSGWMTVSVATLLSLLFNPFALALIGMTFMFYGLVLVCATILTGFILDIFWSFRSKH